MFRGVNTCLNQIFVSRTLASRFCDGRSQHIVTHVSWALLEQHKCPAVSKEQVRLLNVRRPTIHNPLTWTISLFSLLKRKQGSTNERSSFKGKNRLKREFEIKTQDETVNYASKNLLCKRYRPSITALETKRRSISISFDWKPPLDITQRRGHEEHAWGDRHVALAGW